MTTATETTKTFWFPEQLEAGRPPENLSITDWAERDIVLGGDTEKKGPYRIKWTPWAQGIFDLIEKKDFPDLEQLVVCKSAQIGGTVSFLIAHLYRAIQQQRSSLLTYADEKVAVKVIENKLKQLIQSPNVSRTVARQTQYGVYFKSGAHIDIAWASSVASIATFEYPDVNADEIDKPGYSRQTKEADPITNLSQRTETFINKLITLLSTPTTEEGNIWKRLNACDVIFDYHVPCPHCGQFQPLVFSKEHCSGFDDGKFLDKDEELKTLGEFVWEGGRKATREQIETTSGYACGECGAIWTNEEKNNALTQWVMAPRKSIPYSPKRVGLHIWRAYSLLGNSGSISKIVDEYINSLQDPEMLKGFINSTLAEPWKHVVIETNETEILKARVPDLEPQTVPEVAIALTMGVDVQKGYLVYDVWASAEGWTSWLIDYGKIPGWNELETLVFERTYPVQNGSGRMPLWRVGIDIKGGIKTGENITSTDEAYLWIRDNMYRGIEIYACIGAKSELQSKVMKGSIIEGTPGGHKLKGGVQLFQLDIDKNNISLLQRIEAAINTLTDREGTRNQPAYLNSQVGKDWAYHITGIRAELDDKGRRVWKKVHEHDHFDASKIALALTDFQWPLGGIDNLAGNKFQGSAQIPTSGRRTSEDSNRSVVAGNRGRLGGRRIINPHRR